MARLQRKNLGQPDELRPLGRGRLELVELGDVGIRVGVHTGEYEQVGADIRGLAVHVAARVVATSGANEVRLSAATAALLDSSEFLLRSLGPHELKGVPKAVELLALERAVPTAGA